MYHNIGQTADLSQTARMDVGARFVASHWRQSGRSVEVRLCEVVSDEEQRLIQKPGERVGETITIVQTGAMPAALAESLIGVTGDENMFARDRFDQQAKIAD